MVAENPNWYTLNGMRPISQQPSTILSTPPPPFSPRYVSGPSSMPSNHYTQDFPLSWSQLLRSCITGSISSDILDFSTNSTERRIHQDTDHSSQYNGTATSGASKKARVQLSSTQPPLKVRKEKLGDKIAALHQIVSPFGKTDTASVLFEAIKYIRFLQGSIEALSSPYLGKVLASVRHQQSDSPKDLRTRGLCLVPVSCTDHVNIGSDNGVDYWAPSLGGGF